MIAATPTERKKVNWNCLEITDARKKVCSENESLALKLEFSNFLRLTQLRPELSLDGVDDDDDDDDTSKFLTKLT